MTRAEHEALQRRNKVFSRLVDRLLKDMDSDKGAAKKFLIGSGIFDEQGLLTPEYGGTGVGQKWSLE